MLGETRLVTLIELIRGKYLTYCTFVASSPGHSHLFNIACNIEKLGRAWG